MASVVIDIVKLGINDLCTACGICISTCHSGALIKNPLRPEIQHHLCDRCYECVEICPRDAIREVRLETPN